MLGGYQNVDTSDAYLTPHQREALQQFRAEQGSGFRFMVRQHWERLSERTSLLFRRAHGDDSLDSSPFNHRTTQLCALGGVFILFFLFLLSIFIQPPTSAPRNDYPAGPPATRARSPVPKNLQPLPSNKGQQCMDLASQKAPGGQKFIQIHNRCSGEVIYPAMIGQGGGSVLPRWLESIQGGTDGGLEGEEEKGWRFEPGACRTLLVPAIFPSVRLWGRTGCNGTSVQDFKCQTGDCVINGDLSCTSAGDVSSLFEGTFQGWCPAPSAPAQAGIGPDFYDLSLVDGYNLPLGVELVGGHDVPQVSKAMNCINPIIRSMGPEDCPFELRSYSDRLPGWSVPRASITGTSIPTSPCYSTPLDPTCERQFSGCMSLCKAFTEGWLGYYIDTVQGPRDRVDPLITPLSSPSSFPPSSPTYREPRQVRWSSQFLHGNQTKCGVDACRDNLAYGGYRRGVYAAQGHKMTDLVCCAGSFSWSPYQPNNSPAGSYSMACPTLGAGDPSSPYHSSKGGKSPDLEYPQKDQEVRMSSPWPDWPLSTMGGNYATQYKDRNPSVYVWQYNDGANSLYLCCGQKDKGSPHYKITFCPDENGR